MGSKKNDILKLIQKVELDKPALNFTESVMKEVLSQNSHEAVVNTKLKSLLKQHAIDKPAMDFTNDIMTQVKSFGSKKTEPIINKKAWQIIFTALVCSGAGLIFSDGPSTAPKGLTSYFVKFGDMFNTIFVNTNAALYLTTIFSAGVLMLMDYILKIKGRARINNS